MVILQTAQVVKWLSYKHLSKYSDLINWLSGQKFVDLTYITNGKNDDFITKCTRGKKYADQVDCTSC